MVALSDYNYLKDFSSAERALGKSDTKKIGNNTELVRRGPGEIVVELHGHGVVKYERGRGVRLHSAGYKTSTTKDRLNRYTPSYVSVMQRDGVWYVEKRGERQRFQDGMLIRT